MAAAAHAWRFIRIGLVVTGEGEWDFLPELLREIAATGHAHFFVLRRTGQRTGLSEARIDDYVNQGKQIPDHDAEVAYDIRRHVATTNHYAIWIDDLESDSRADAVGKVGRLTRALNVVMGKRQDLRERCSAHMLVNMLEAYYFAHTDAVNGVNLNRRGDGEEIFLDLKDHAGDCENITHPKNELKKAAKSLDRGVTFDEVTHGGEIVRSLDLERVLSDPTRCRALRTLVAWCWEAIGEPRDERFRLSDGVYWDVTAPQLRIPPSAEQIGPLSEEEPYRPMA